MGWLLLGLIVGASYGALWVWVLLGDEDDDPTMPADARRRDGWRDEGR